MKTIEQKAKEAIDLFAYLMELQRTNPVLWQKEICKIWRKS